MNLVTMKSQSARVSASRQAPELFHALLGIGLCKRQEVVANLLIKALA
jgi:hypothetical protein